MEASLSVGTAGLGIQGGWEGGSSQGQELLLHRAQRPRLSPSVAMASWQICL